MLVNVLLPYVPSILELVQHCAADDDRSESTIKMCYGLIGDLADSYSNGQIKQLLLAEWVVQTLRSKVRVTQDTKATMRWAKEVSILSFLCLSNPRRVAPLPVKFTQLKGVQRPC